MSIRSPKIAAAAVLAVSSLAAADTIIVSPNSISGTVSWNNSNPAVLAILQQVPMSNYTVMITSTSPAGFSGQTSGTAASSASSNYSFAAEANGGAGQVTYSASAQALYYGEGAIYNFHPQSVTLQPIAMQPHGATLNFSETITVHQIRFGTDSTCDTPVTVKGGSVISSIGNDLFNGGSVAYYFAPNYPALGPNLPADQATLNVTLGSDEFADTLNLQFPIDVSAAGDQVIDHCVPLPVSGDGTFLGNIVTPIGVAEHTLVYINNDYGTAYGPAGNLRFGYLTAGQPLSFINLVPGAWTPLITTRLDPGSVESEINTSPDWSNSSYSPIEISAGETTDGAQMIDGVPHWPFALTPATLGGTLRFYDEYAQEHPGAASTLSSLVFGEDYSQDGVSVNGPAFGTNIGEFSSDSLNQALTSSAGRYQATIGELLSTYALPLPLLYDQPLSWPTQPTLSMFFSSTALSTYQGDFLTMEQYGVPSDSDELSFRFGNLYLGPLGNPTTQVLGPDYYAQADLHYCFNEVVAQLQSTTGLFVNPTIGVSGSYNGVDFEGNQVSYSGDGSFTGQPYVGQLVDNSVYLANRTSSGSIAFTLPQGNWALTPSASFVVNDGTYSTDNFTNTSLSLGCGQRVTLVPGLTLSLDQPAECVAPSGGAELVTIAGTINSNGAAVDRVWYTINDGAEVDICENSACGDSFSVSAALASGDNAITVYASSGYVSGTPQVTQTISCGPNGCGSGCTSVAPTCTEAIYSPGENEYGMVAFEDLWPINGDLDFNDENIAYNYAFILDGNGGVAGLTATFDMLSLGATLHNGLYLHLPIPAGAAGTAWLSTGSGNALSLMPLTTLGDSQQLGDAVYRLAEDTRTLFGNSSGYIDTVAGDPVLSGTPVTLSIVFGTSLAQDSTGLDIAHAPFDLFIARTGTEDHQIHLPRYSGAATGAAAGLFGGGDDRSNVSVQDGADNSGRWYVNEQGLPFGLVIPVLADWPLERTAIDNLFPEISEFASSAGASGQSFYSDDVVASYSWQQSLSVPAPLPPAPPAPGAPAFPGVSICQ